MKSLRVTIQTKATEQCFFGTVYHAIQDGSLMVYGSKQFPQVVLLQHRIVCIFVVLYISVLFLLWTFCFYPLFYKNVAFPAHAEYSYFSTDFRLKVFLNYS